MKTTYKVSVHKKNKQKVYYWKELRKFFTEKQARTFARTLRDKAFVETAVDKVEYCKMHNQLEDVGVWIYYPKAK